MKSGINNSLTENVVHCVVQILNSSLQDILQSLKCLAVDNGGDEIENENSEFGREFSLDLL